MTTPKSIDPALAAMNEFAVLCPDTAKAVQSMRRRAIYKDGALPARHKALAAMLWSISARCEPCVKFYAAESKRLGATMAELGEFLAVAGMMGGCVGETWAVKALHAFNSAGARDAAEPVCCEPAAHQ